ncbi:MAG TPA: hypothetical protein VMI06_09310 [Terriglobia bacterium]|nr:hypothetical protein [Terriglobia bacterium]
MRADKRRRDFIDAEARQDVENERHLRLLRQPRLAAGEHHPQQIVLARSEPLHRTALNGGHLCFGSSHPKLLGHELVMNQGGRWADGSIVAVLSLAVFSLSQQQTAGPRH